MILFTGFGPFANVEYNPSWDCARFAAQVCHGDADLLPVTLAAAKKQVESWPDARLRVHFGVARTRDWVSLERYAHNWWRDLDDECPRRLVADGPVAVESSLPLEEWVVELDGAAGLDWRVSHDAGTYVCNATLYWTLWLAGDAVFIHVPPVRPDIAREIGKAVGSFLA